jgi:hypothetical protein
MDEQREQADVTEQRFGAVMGWWGIGSNRVIEDRVQRFQQLASGLHRAYSEACHDQLEALSVANECVSRSFQGFLNGPRPDEIFAAETEVLSGLMKATSLQMQAWSDFSQKIQGCYVDVARETASDIGQEAREVTSEVEEQVQQTIRATKQRIRRAAKAPDDQSSGT